MLNDFVLSDGTRVHLIGDPHLGRRFGEEQGVPRHRLGEREMSQAAHFTAELDVDADVIVMIGDLFDNPTVPPSVIVAAARAALGAAERTPDTLFVMLAGNHDKPRNMTTVGAWHAFREMTQHRLDNLIILDRPLMLGRLAFFPWEWDRRADDQVADLAHATGVEHAVGHWDLSVFDGKDDHLAPVDSLQSLWPGCGMWSGHYHKAGVYLVHDFGVNCTGSMEPYAHGEGDMYVTLSLADALARDDLHDKCVRVVLQPGEDMPEIDCMALTHKRVRVDSEDEKITVSIEDFDFHRIIRERIKERDPRVRAHIEERMSLAAEE